MNLIYHLYSCSVPCKSPIKIMVKENEFGRVFHLGRVYQLYNIGHLDIWNDKIEATPHRRGGKYHRPEVWMEHLLRVVAGGVGVLINFILSKFLDSNTKKLIVAYRNQLLIYCLSSPSWTKAKSISAFVIVFTQNRFIDTYLTILDQHQLAI